MPSWRNTRTHLKRNGERGYALMTLLLTMALLVIFAAAIVPTIKFQIEHDREEEMIHRGVQYSRAIRKYYKKFGRYPVKIEDLQDANNMRFLRKRYKDPMNCSAGTCQDFKLLHFGEVKLTFGGGLIPGATQVGAPGFAPTSPGGNPGLAPTTLGGNPGFGANSGSSLGQNPQTNSQAAGSNSSSSDQSSQQVSGADNSSDRSSPDQPVQQFGGGPIVGVVSGSKKEGYREFNHKKKYNEWQFIYDPALDRGGLLMTPNQPPLFEEGIQKVQGKNPGQPGASGVSSPGATSNPATTPPSTAPTEGGEAPTPDQNAPPQQQ